MWALHFNLTTWHLLSTWCVCKDTSVQWDAIVTGFRTSSVEIAPNTRNQVESLKQTVQLKEIFTIWKKNPRCIKMSYNLFQISPRPIFSIHYFLCWGQKSKRNKDGLERCVGGWDRWVNGFPVCPSIRPWHGARYKSLQYPSCEWTTLNSQKQSWFQRSFYWPKAEDWKWLNTAD